MKNGNRNIWFSYDYAPGSNLLLLAIPLGLLVARPDFDGGWLGAVLVFGLTSLSYLQWQIRDMIGLFFTGDSATE